MFMITILNSMCTQFKRGIWAKEYFSYLTLIDNNQLTKIDPTPRPYLILLVIKNNN